MLRKLLGHMRQNVVAYFALFIALGGTSAYAANTIRSGDIIDNEVTTTDVRDDTLGFGGLLAQDLAAGSVGTSEVANASLTGADIANGSLLGADVADGQLLGSKIVPNTLTGDHINESTLNLPQTPTTATFAGQGNVNVTNSFSQIVAKALPAGSYAIAATANVAAGVGGADAVRDTFCELRNGGAFIGGGRDRRFIAANTVTTISLSMNGGVQVPAGGGVVSLHCRFEGGNSEIGDGQMMIIRLDGFF